MSTIDKKEYGLVTQTVRPRPRRSLSMRDYSLPKPYRKKVFVEEAPARSKTQIALWTISGILVAGLVAELSMLAQETMRQRALPIIAAAPPPPARPVLDVPSPPRAARHKAAAAVAGTAAGSLALPARITLPVAQAGVLTAARTGAAKASPHPAPAGKAVKPPRPQAAIPAPEQDPDVVLITAILLLAPQLQAVPTQNACTAGPARDTACADLHGMLP